MVTRSVVLIRNRPSHTMAALTIASSLVMTTLASADAMAPGRSVDFVPKPVATTGAHLRSLDTVPNLSVTTLVGQDIYPFQQNDWPNPRKGGALAVSISTLPGEVEAEAEPEPDPSPFAPIEFPNPQSKARAQAFAHYSLLESTLAPTADANPFAQAHWPNPVRPRFKADRQRHQGFYVVDESSPFAQTGWPNPVLAKQQPGLRSITSSRSRVLEEPTAPFAQNEWPVPAQKRAAIERLTWLATRALVLAEPGLPFSQTSWPVPRSKGQSPELLTISEWRDLSIVDESPRHNRDWPNPVLAPKRPTLSFTHSLLEQPTVSDRPFVLADQPNPAPWKYPTLSFTTELREPLLQLLEPTPPYPVQHDWPLFRPTPPAIELRTWLQARPFFYEDATPANQFDWPVPAKVKRPEGQGWFTSPQLGILGLPAEAHYIVRVRADVGIVRVRPDPTTSRPR